MLSVFAVLTVLAAASAASVSRRDQTSCSTAINATLFSTDPATMCFRPDILAKVVKTATTHQKVAPSLRHAQITGWLELMCEKGFCSDQTLENIASTVEAGCGSDLSGLPGITLPQGLSVVTALKQNYPAMRDLLCLQNTARSNQFCMTELLADNRAEDLYNADPAAMVGKLMDLALNNTDCNECTKAAEYFTLTATLNTAPVGINHTALDAEFKPNGVMGLAVPSLSLSLTILVVLAVL
ncbi:hypothetical protein B0H13DRAFT_2569792 [Mycena leptocephala]|nr:hypothetical protein B0H13DRAFT_2569792 [Mycena leptocephala]